MEQELTILVVNFNGENLKSQIPKIGNRKPKIIIANTLILSLGFTFLNHPWKAAT